MQAKVEQMDGFSDASINTIIPAIVAAIVALSAPFVKSFFERNKMSAETENIRIVSASTLIGASNETARVTLEMYNELQEDFQSFKTEARTEILDLKGMVKALQDENSFLHRSYRVVWDGAKKNAIRIQELGEIPPFDPPADIFRGNAYYGPKREDNES